MKTIDEVIKALTICKNPDINRNCKDCPMPDTQECMGVLMTDALHYLKEYRKKLNILKVRMAEYKRGFEQLGVEWSRIKDNPPLTWDELKQMERKPVWVEYNLHISDRDARSRMWIIVQKIMPWRQGDELIYYSGFVFSKKEIGETWKAYRKERS